MGSKQTMMPAQLPAEDKRHLRPILPRQGHRSLRAMPSTPLRVRPSPVLAACIACRKDKTKCSGDRPACRRCLQRHVECIYTTRAGETPSQALSRKHDSIQEVATAHQELFNRLRELPEQDAYDVFRKIRSGVDATTILNHIKTGDILLQMAVAPETRLRYEFPYRSEMPECFASNSPYLDSLLYESTSLYPHSPGSGVAKDAVSGLADRHSYLMPFHAADVVEPALTDVRISQWTTVCDDDMLMQDLLRVFLRCEYQFTAAFQKDYFLDDMAAQRRDFCSPLLVNIVLAYSCVCYPSFSHRATYWDTQTLLGCFFAEAKRLWELEAAEARITTIQAGILLTAFHNLCGLDEVGKGYRIRAIALAQRLHLFDSITDVDDLRMQTGRAFTAWALYNWETLTAFSFVHSPLLTAPPTWPLPNPFENVSWYGEIWVRYPSSQVVTPTRLGSILQARCEFRIIMNDFCHMAYSDSPGVTFDQARELHERLRTWYDNLSQPLLPRSIVLPGHLQLHVYYHHLILTIYKTLLDVPATLQQHEPLLEQVIAESKKSLQLLIRLYYLRHGFEAMDLFIVIPLMMIGYDCIDHIGEQTSELQLEVLRATLILVAQGLYYQRQNHYLAVALFRVIRGRMRPQEVSLLRSSMKDDDEEIEPEQDMTQPVRSQWPVTVVGRTGDVDSHVLTNLVKKYAQLNVDVEVEVDEDSLVATSTVDGARALLDDERAYPAEPDVK